MTAHVPRPEGTARAGLRTIAVIGAALAVLLVGWFIALWWPDLDVERLGQVGDTVGPIVGILSLLAVLAALDSLRLQSQAVTLQRTALDEQRTTLSDEMELQREAVKLQGEALVEQRAALRDELDLQRSANKLQADALESQQRALQTEITMQRHTALGTAYAKLFGTLDVYVHEVGRYIEWIKTTSTDRPGRASRQVSIQQKYEEVRLARWAVHFVDPDRERERMRNELARQHRLEPIGADTTETQRTNAQKVRARITQDNIVRHHLRDHLLREMGFLADPDDQHNEATEVPED